MWPLALLFLAPGTFDSDIAPLLRAKCVVCHSAAKRSGGLSLESRDEV